MIDATDETVAAWVTSSRRPDRYLVAPIGPSDTESNLMTYAMQFLPESNCHHGPNIRPNNRLLPRPSPFHDGEPARRRSQLSCSKCDPAGRLGMTCDDLALTTDQKVGRSSRPERTGSGQVRGGAGPGVGSVEVMPRCPPLWTPGTPIQAGSPRALGCCPQYRSGRPGSARRRPPQFGSLGGRWSAAG